MVLSSATESWSHIPILYTNQKNQEFKIEMTEGYMLRFFPSMTFLDNCPRTIDYFRIEMPIHGQRE